MWRVARSIHKLNQITRMWILTLEISGCAKMMQAGDCYNKNVARMQEVVK